MKLYMVIVHGNDAEDQRFEKIFYHSNLADAKETCEQADRCLFAWELYRYISRSRRYKEIMRG